MKSRKPLFSGGMPANYIIIPLIAAAALMQILTVLFVYDINSSDNEYVRLMQLSGTCQQEATNIQAGSSTLSETLASLVQNPVLNGEINSAPLAGYAEEYASGRLGAQVAARYEKLDIDSGTLEAVKAAAKTASRMESIQLRAIALVDSVYPVPETPEFAAIPSLPLSEIDSAITPEARLSLAKGLITGRDYSLLKRDLADAVNRAHYMIQTEFDARTSGCERHIALVRAMLWTVIVLLFALLAGSFYLLFRWVILPLREYSNLITSDSRLTAQGPILELRLVVAAYNELLARRSRLEGILRSAAETDALTGLSNRYGLEHYVLEHGDGARSLAVLIFDVNYLKRVNDTKGHQYGDRLICSTARCISECFGSVGDDNCFRTGGDEFTAVIYNTTGDDIARRIERFRMAEVREHISVSVGCAYSEELEENGFASLMEEADRRMYEDKKRMHSFGFAAVPGGV